MGKQTEIIGSRVLVVGYGREGKSIQSWLSRHHPAVSVTIADKARDGEAYLSDLASYSTVIRSPGVSPFLPEFVDYVRAGGHMTSATNIFFSICPGTTIGVTGTKGKSTTASLIAHILSGDMSDVRLVGNIGKPMLDYVEEATSRTVFVVELSSHQLTDARYSPHIAVLLDIVPEHMDYYPDMNAYVAAKSNIVRHQSHHDVAVYNPTHPLVKSMCTGILARPVTFGDRENAHTTVYVDSNDVCVGHGTHRRIVMSVSEIPLLGNVENIQAAVSVSLEMGVPLETIAARVRSFTPLPHRMELVGTMLGIRFYNDSLSTIPEATIHALRALGIKVETLIAGGYDRHLDFSVLGRYLADHPVRNLILFPDTGARIRQAWEKATGVPGDGRTRIFMVSTMEEAVDLAFAHTAKGGICLLSPGSASYNLFRDYADRGDQFRDWVVKKAALYEHR